jgi:hypothetical protein
MEGRTGVLVLEYGAHLFEKSKIASLSSRARKWIDSLQFEARSDEDEETISSLLYDGEGSNLYFF